MIVPYDFMQKFCLKASHLCPTSRVVYIIIAYIIIRCTSLNQITKQILLFTFEVTDIKYFQVGRSEKWRRKVGCIWTATANLELRSKVEVAVATHTCLRLSASYQGQINPPINQVPNFGVAGLNTTAFSYLQRVLMAFLQPLVHESLFFEAFV